MNDWTGGCLCGTVRYRLGIEPFDAGWCHCRTCELNRGARAILVATVPIGDYWFEAGEQAVRRTASSSFGHRAFCGECGTPLYTHVEHQPDTLDFSVATLDEPGRVRPGFHIWLQLDDDLPKFDRFRPNTVGLVGTEPPA